MREDLKLPTLDDLAEVVSKMQAGLDADKEMMVTVLKAMNQEMIISARDAK